MISRSRFITNPLSLGILIVEGVALLLLGLAFTTDYWYNGSSKPGLIGAFLLIPAIWNGIVAGIMLLVNIFRRGKIDMGTITAVAPFMGCVVWGLWKSYTDRHWAHNLPTYWGIFGIVLALWAYAIIKYAKQKRS